MSVKPPFRADHVGSLLRPHTLIEAHTAHSQGRLPACELSRLEDGAILDAIAMQERVGLRAITDGEMRRNNWRDRFFERVDGFSKNKVELIHLHGIRWKRSSRHAHPSSRCEAK
jgi:5-methyltetrahydropteroyltriglutamate--homocysteine methyltransferase